MNLKKWLPLAIVVTILGIILYTGVYEKLSLSSLIQQREWLRETVANNFVLAILGYMALYAFLVAVSFPVGAPLTVTSGFIFGWAVGGFATVIGATIGAIIIFLVARSSFGELLQDKAGGFVEKMAQGFRKDAFQYLLTLRLIPAFPFWVVNIVPGLLKMNFVPFAVATFFGIIPGTLAFAYLGHGLDSVIAKQEEANPGCADAGTCSIDPGALLTSEMIIALLALPALSFIPFIVKKISGNKNRLAEGGEAGGSN